MGDASDGAITLSVLLCAPSDCTGGAVLGSGAGGVGVVINGCGAHMSGALCKLCEHGYSSALGDACVPDGDCTAGAWTAVLGVVSSAAFAAWLLSRARASRDPGRTSQFGPAIFLAFYLQLSALGNVTYV
jgi:hypothetical protein